MASREPRDRAHHAERRAAVEDDVAREKHAALGDPRHHIVGRVRWANVYELHLKLAGVQGQPVGERHVGRDDLDISPFDIWPERRQLQAGRENLVAGQRVPDDRRLGKHEVPIRMVTVVVSVH